MKIKYSIKFLKVCSFIFFVFTISNLVNGQSLKGTVTEAESGEAVPMANVVVKSGHNIVQGGATDFDGNYNVSPLSSGVYTVEVSFIGFETKKILNVEIKSQNAKVLNVKLIEGEQVIGCQIFCGEPMIDPFHTGATYTSEDINEMPIMR
ncbi:MAG: carboxypeptidase-like regulatory domain-containing protein [Flavobacteriales bacterium]